MTVRELMRKLVDYNPNAGIVCWDNDSDGITVTSVDTSEDTDSIHTDNFVCIHVDI